MKKFGFILILALIFVGTGAGQAISFEKPRVGIVISKTNFDHRWGVTQMAAHGWAGVVNLAGFPYKTLFIEDIVAADDLAEYSLLIFAQCTFIKQAQQNPLQEKVQNYVAQGGNVIIDGPLAFFDADENELDRKPLYASLGLRYTGAYGDKKYRLKATGEPSYITKQFGPDELLSQALTGSLNISEPRDGGDTWIVATNDTSTYPFLSTYATENNRFVYVSDFSTWAGAASFFRNRAPQGFYANQIINAMIKSVEWAVYGDIQTPFPAPQLSNAPLTAIIRLDADASDNAPVQHQTMHYLADVARETGVVSVYAWVASGAKESAWDSLAPLGQMIEDLGGEIGTHSNYHRIEQQMTPERWAAELDSAILGIETSMAEENYPIGDIDYFINPGNTIRMCDYDEVSDRFSFFMTHGFEQDMPLGYGNLTWYAKNNPDFVVIENNPSPDYQWFYDPNWSYTTHQISLYEEAIFDHMYENIGRGVLFNQMWHDYSITSQQYGEKDRIINTSNIEFYNAIRAKFAAHNIYAPTPNELGNKLRAMAQWDYGWRSSGDTITMTIDISRMRNSEAIASAVGGMGLRIENTGQFIQSVQINEQPHFGYTDQLIILPDLQPRENTIAVVMGREPADIPRLTYVSKRMKKNSEESERLKASIQTESLAKFIFHSPETGILLNTASQYRDEGKIHGIVRSSSVVQLWRPEFHNFTVNFTNCIIRGGSEKEYGITIILESDVSEKPVFAFESEKEPDAIYLDKAKVEFTSDSERNAYRIKFPEQLTGNKLTIRFSGS